MATSLGIHLRADGFSFAVVEGGAKKHVLKSSGEGVVPAGTAPRAVGKLVADMVKMRKADHVSVVTPSGRVVLRELSLPFTEREKVLQVLKFEVESELYHLSVDEVVVDFIALEGARATPSLLVGIMPKSHVRQALDAASGGGWDPHSVQASYAAYSYALNVLAPRLLASKEEETEPALFVHLGAVETLVAQVGASGHLRAMRTIPVGWLELTRDLAPLREAEGEVIPPGAEAEESEAPAAADSAKIGKEEAAVPEAILFGADPALIGCTLSEAIRRAGDARCAALCKRLANEVRRAMAAMPGDGATVVLTGADIPGWERALTVRTGCQLRKLDSTIGDEERRTDLVALGAAFAGLGIAQTPMNFRMEEFRYARGLERVEGPLTLALVGLIAWLVIDAGVHVKQGMWQRDQAEMIYRDADARVVQLNKRVKEDEEYPDEWLVKNDLTGADIAASERVRVLAGRVNDAKRQRDQLMGEADVEMPASGLEAWRLLMNFLERELGTFNEKWMIESFDFVSVDKTRGNNEVPAHVVAKFGLTLKSEDAEMTAGVFDRIERGLRAEPWCVGNPVIPSTEAAKVGPGKTATITVKIRTDRERADGGAN